MGARSGGTTAKAVILAVLASGHLASAQHQNQSVSAEDSLKEFLRKYMRELSLDEDKTTKYLAAFVDLNGDGANEAIVYLTGRTWCGTGGCNMLILRRDGTSWKEVTAMTITRTPIRVLASASNRWQNIGVWVEGGGIQPGYEAELTFDGKTYPTNPTVLPARRLTRKTPGRVILSSSHEETPLY